MAAAADGAAQAVGELNAEEVVHAAGRAEAALSQGGERDGGKNADGQLRLRLKLRAQLQVDPVVEVQIGREDGVAAVGRGVEQRVAQADADDLPPLQRLQELYGLAQDRAGQLRAGRARRDGQLHPPEDDAVDLRGDEAGAAGGKADAQGAQMRLVDVQQFAPAPVADGA